MTWVEDNSMGTPDTWRNNGVSWNIASTEGLYGCRRRTPVFSAPKAFVQGVAVQAGDDDGDGVEEDLRVTRPWLTP
jgi:hypothetical protein